jgi:hypothetical protein
MRALGPWLTALTCLLAGCTDETPPAPAAADAGEARLEAHTATLVAVAGQVRIKRSGAPDWQPAAAGTALAANDKVRTQRDSFATIRFEEGDTLRLEPESLVAVTDLRIDRRSRAQRSTFTLHRGRLEADIGALDEAEAEFKIKTPSAEAELLSREVAFQ